MIEEEQDGGKKPTRERKNKIEIRIQQKKIHMGQ